MKIRTRYQCREGELSDSSSDRTARERIRPGYDVEELAERKIEAIVVKNF